MHFIELEFTLVDIAFLPSVLSCARFHAKFEVSHIRRTLLIMSHSALAMHFAQDKVSLIDAILKSLLSLAMGLAILFFALI